MGPAILVACDDLVEAAAIELALEHGFGANVDLRSVDQILDRIGSLRPRVMIVSCPPDDLARLRQAVPPACTMIVLHDEWHEAGSAAARDAPVGADDGLVRLGRPVMLDQLVAIVGRCLDRSRFAAVPRAAEADR